MSSSSNRLYLPSLNAVRAISAIIVMIAHIEAEKDGIGLSRLLSLIPLGEIGVTIFFTLSGYLITYLLITEKNQFGSIDIKGFYMRRILRIWPLFYLILIMGYWIVPTYFPSLYPSSDFKRNSLGGVFLNMFFLTNVTFILKFTPLFIHTIWSIGVEEQFYIFWPWLSMKNNQRFKSLILFVICIIPILKITFLVLSRFIHLSVFEDIYHIICVSKFDSMALGGLFALLYFEKKLSIFKFEMNCEFFYKRSIQRISYLIFVGYFLILMFVDSRFGHLYPFFSFVTGIILMNLSTNKNTIISLENKFLSSIGQISYGIYLWHMPIIFMFYNYMHAHGTFQAYSSLSFFIHPIIMICVCIISYVSYYYFEVKFLKLKKRFAKILT